MKNSRLEKQVCKLYQAPEAIVVELSVERGFNMSMPEIDDEVDKQITNLDKWTDWED